MKKRKGRSEIGDKYQYRTKSIKKSLSSKTLQKCLEHNEKDAREKSKIRENLIKSHKREGMKKTLVG